ncbi:MAG TPA: pyrophosphatase PpaX [Pseudogracilibacillus sp.]|nr:pyrophosphatase PpaX [Pseudogracilibacillus sp.]
MNIKTVLFDLDGTLIDTNELIDESFRHTFKKYNYVFTDEEIRGFNGPPLRDTFTNLNNGLAEEMIQTYREHNLANHEAYVRAFPHVEETIKALLEMDIKVGIVSAKMKPGVELGLSIVGLSKYFDTIVSIDDVTNPKPHPESVCLAMEQLQAKPAATIMVGDNSHDIEAGKDAGAQTAAVAWSKKGKVFLQQYNPTYMLENMKDLIKIVGG